MYIDGGSIKDQAGRVLLLRGCNLGGNSKIPMPETGGEETAPLSFTGRPFPLEEADSHFKRFRRWGFSLIRLVITWEALEHQGPGIYDEAYIAYLRKLLKKAEEWDLPVFIDPHQDLWSRVCGGDGAPAWTLEKIGIDTDKLVKVEESAGRKPGSDWAAAYNNYGAATMFSLFFGGKSFAPFLSIDGENAQDWLQGRYIAAFRHCFRRLKNAKAICGWGSMNEPHPGFIGYTNLENLEQCIVASGPIPFPLDAMAAASGHSREIPVYHSGIRGVRIKGKAVLNPGKISVFKAGYSCPWEQAGVWTGTELLKPYYFSALDGKPVCFTGDFLRPFIGKFIETMKEADRPCFFFIEGPPDMQKTAKGETRRSGQGPKEHGGKTSFPAAQGSVIHAFHWYDGATLFTKSFRPALSYRADKQRLVFGKKNVARSFAGQLAGKISRTKEYMGNIPCLLGEFGLPFDLKNSRGFDTGDYSLQEEALSLYYDAIDRNLLHALIWNYTAGNTHARGDHWNGEDFSIFSEGEPRALDGWLRPYPAATAGAPLFFSWDRKKRRLCYVFNADSSIAAPTEIFLPARCFGDAPRFSVRGTVRGTEESGFSPKLRAAYDAERQRLVITNEGIDAAVEVRCAPGPNAPR